MTGQSNICFFLTFPIAICLSFHSRRSHRSYAHFAVKRILQGNTNSETEATNKSPRGTFETETLRIDSENDDGGYSGRIAMRKPLTTSEGGGSPHIPNNSDNDTGNGNANDLSADEEEEGEEDEEEEEEASEREDSKDGDDDGYQFQFEKDVSPVFQSHETSASKTLEVIETEKEDDDDVNDAEEEEDDEEEKQSSDSSHLLFSDAKESFPEAPSNSSEKDKAALQLEEEAMASSLESNNAIEYVVQWNKEVVDRILSGNAEIPKSRAEVPFATQKYSSFSSQSSMDSIYVVDEIAAQRKRKNFHFNGLLRISRLLYEKEQILAESYAFLPQEERFNDGMR